MTINESYQLYHDQYKNHCRRLATFLHDIEWDHDDITVDIRRMNGDPMVIIKRPDKKKRIYDARQVIGMIRMVAEYGQRIEEAT